MKNRHFCGFCSNSILFYFPVTVFVRHRRDISNFSIICIDKFEHQDHPDHPGNPDHLDHLDHLDSLDQQDP